MNLNFIFSNLNAIILVIWIFFWFFVAIRFFYPSWVKNISYTKFVVLGFLLNIVYGLFITWGQYYVWLHSSNFTRLLVNSPLSKEVPMYNFIRPLFENNLGYFLYYALGRFWFYIFILFIVSLVFYFFIRFWKSYRGNFSENSSELFLVLMLISGWPGIVIFIPLGFIVSIIISIVYYFFDKRTFKIEPVFIFVSLFALIFSKIILGFF